MKNLLFVFLILLCAGIISCQKELTGLPGSGSSGSGGGGTTTPPSTNGDLLIKLYGQIGTADSNVIYYTYNSAKQMIAMRNIITTNGGINNWSGFERNTSGLIIRRKQYFTSGLIPIPADTGVTVYYYSTGPSPHITYSVGATTFAGLTVNDSSVYSYNTAGRLIKTELYQSNILTNSFSISSRTLYTIDASDNMTKLQIYNLSSGTAILTTTQTFTYDAKVPPITYTEAESIAINDQPASKNNVVNYQTTNAVVGAGNITSNATYTYNSANKPATAKQVVIYNGTTTTNLTFYYQ